MKKTKCYPALWEINNFSLIPLNTVDNHQTKKLDIFTIECHQRERLILLYLTKYIIYFDSWELPKKDESSKMKKRGLNDPIQQLGTSTNWEDTSKIICKEWRRYSPPQCRQNSLDVSLHSTHSTESSALT